MCWIAGVVLKSKAVKIGGDMTGLDRAFRNLDFSSLVTDYLQMVSDLQATKKIKESVSDTRGRAAARMIFLFFAALVANVARKGWHEVPLARWKEDSEKAGLTDKQILTFIELAAQAPSIPESELIAMAVNQQTAYQERLLAALVLSITKGLAPEMLFKANYLLITGADLLQWRELIASDVERIVVAGWKYVALQQAFALVMPNITTADIEAACNSAESGLKKAARILLAAEQAVSIQMPQEARAALQRIAALDNSIA